jgi:hypothetical protein
VAKGGRRPPKGDEVAIVSKQFAVDGLVEQSVVEESRLEGGGIGGIEELTGAGEIFELLGASDANRLDQVGIAVADEVGKGRGLPVLSPIKSRGIFGLKITSAATSLACSGVIIVMRRSPNARLPMWSWF